MENKSLKIKIVILATLLFMSSIVNILLYYALTVVVIEDSNNYDNLDVQYCMLINEHIKYSNDLLKIIQSYEESYYDVEYLEEEDCISIFEDE